MSDLDPRTLVRLMKESEHLSEDPYSGKTFRPLWLRRLSIHEEVLGRNNPAAGGGIGEIRYGYSDSPFGLCRIEVGAQGILSLNFLDSPKVLDQAAAHALMLRRWPGVRCTQDHALAKTLLGDIFARDSRAPLSLHLRGSQFHLKVWRSLLTIPESCLVSYARLARMADSPGASRAVGGAVASNPIGYLVPCHRVLRTDGHLGGFKWGLERKKAMIAYEAALSDIDFRTAEGARDR